MHDKANELALEAIMKLDVSVFKVFATLDINHPETINNFAKFGELLHDAYKQGLQESAEMCNTIALQYEQANAHSHSTGARECQIFIQGLQTK